MSDLISREAAIERIEGLVATMSVCLSREECNGMRSMKERAINAVKELPTAEPEMIRCKDCYHYPSEYSDCPMIGWFRHEDDYCSRAERRSDG